MDKEALLTIDGLLIQFGGLKAVNNVDIHVNDKEFIGLIGPNGAGKTTLFNSITGGVNITAGEIKFNDKALNKKRPDQISRMGISRTFQNIRLFSKMTAIENISIAIHSVPKYSIIEAMLRTPRARVKDKEVREQAQFF
ncbi:MAG: ATP-binding cassette domain-containing protein, partial [Bacillota bacterium]|nr:ATP-binding cassette domain-containing protein [Bacillota bacterium]